MAYFYGSVLVLALLLFFPASRLIWVLSVRRLERKLGRRLRDAELEGQLRRARVVTVPLALAFSWLFNVNLIGLPGGG